MTEASQEIRILLVDDEADFLEAVRPGLARRGFQVATAESGQAALDLLSSETFDVIVLDVKMPGIDGVDTFREIKRIAPTLPVILLTGHGNVEQAFETSREGVFEYLTKPCDVATLASLARQASDPGRASKTPRKAGSGESIRLLLVDNDSDFVQSITPPLERRGAIVTVAHNGRDALRYASDEELHVAVVDLVMPGVDGLTLLRQLRQADPLLEVIVLTGHATAQNARQGLKDGAFDFLMKPLPVESLFNRIHAAYEHRRQEEYRIRKEEVERILTDMPD
jgi:DNA-binding NtrC family response regulator